MNRSSSHVFCEWTRAVGPRGLWSLAALGVAASAWAFQQPTPTPAATKPHPRLVSAQTARCLNCHETLLTGKTHVHAPVKDDCLSCHAVEIDASGTRIHLAGEQPALCLTCHSDLEAAAAGKLKSAHAPVAGSCTDCHDPHASAVPGLLTARPAELCATCHDISGLQGSHGGQLGASVSCARCHAPHGSANPKLLTGSVLHAPFADKSCEACHRAPIAGRLRLQGRADALCSSCHGDIPIEAAKSGSWHPALKGSRTTSGCLACHDPHLSPNRRLLVKTGTALCESCHREVVRAAKAKGGHAPAAEDCLSCHKPHLAPKPSLLADAPRAVCLGCHDAADAGIVKAHLGAKLDALDCTACHTPHGAGNAKALARYVHPPVTQGCDVCHQGSASKLVEDGNPPLCLTCHEQIGQTAKSAKVPHAAMEAARCVDCHNPHASAEQRLVKSPAGAECLVCHTDQGANAGESAHGAITLVGCQACHEPHGGARPKLLRAAGNDLCLGCHRTPESRPPAEGMVQLTGRFDVPASAARAMQTVLLTPDAKRGHPVPNHPVAGVASSDPHAKRIETTFKGELSCIACHDPHKGKSPQILRWDASSGAEACLNCHKK